MSTSIKERTAAMLRLLMESGALSAGDLAEALGVSTKTVSRDLPEAEDFLQECGGGTIQKKKGAGLLLKASPKELKALAAALSGVKQHTVNPKERLSYIVSRLLPESEPVKLYALASALGVTESTVSSDLTKLDDWFEARGLKLQRKPGLGVYVEGGEREIRKAIIAYIYDHVTEEELLNLVHANLSEEDEGFEDQASAALLNLVDREIIHRLELVIREAEKAMRRRLSDDAFIGLLVHLALAVQRLRKGERIRLERGYLSRLKGKKEFRAAETIAEKISDEFSLTVTEDEKGYIAMHLLGARSRYREESVSGTVLDNFHLVRLAKSIMRLAEGESGEPLNSNAALLAGLVNHLGPAISRIELNMDIRNPLLEEMQQKFPKLMALAQRSVGDAERELGLKFPPEEVGYIAMHLSAALAGKDLLSRYASRIIVACPTGMGTSRLLSGQISKFYDNITIVAQVASLELSPEMIKKCEADFIVSTVPIPALPVPVVVVNALLGKDDRDALDEAISRVSSVQVERKAKAHVKVDFPSALRVMNAYGGAVLSLLDGFFFLDERSAMTVGEVAAAIGRRLGKGMKEAEAIERSLLARENQGSTAVVGSAMILLHARTEAVSSLKFGIVHLGSSFFYTAEPEERIRTAIVMLAPKNCSCYELETIGHISSILLERWGLIEVLHEGDERHIHAELVRIFRTFYEEKQKELLEE